MNIIETVQKSLGFNALEKIDPNTQETVGPDNPVGNNALAQAGIPAILLGLYNKMEDNPDTDLLKESPKGDLLTRIFGKSKDAVLASIAKYCQVTNKHSEQELEHIAAESIRVVKTQLGEAADEKAIRNFAATNKPEVLLYLPPALELGSILHNENLDDRTGKMEGPVSSFMHRVEKAFNTSVGTEKTS